ncbi:hypothetical protein M595_1204 [Lyngbya aestuarii BL J]|uniref:Uncharacterized protein n=1 Tax=Lyngbya aestuarii BL J TaxID=1348334 RepID=U7QP93_9CYAN|nr:hypothetical protein M595_1204 [Lyngbya aestuarii BL J]
MIGVRGGALGIVERSRHPPTAVIKITLTYDPRLNFSVFNS